MFNKSNKLFSRDLKVFFIKYNDPIYVKMTKLELLVRLTDEANIDLVLSELKEYAQEVDVDFVRKAVRSIGRCTIKIETAADKCMEVLISLIHSKVNYVVQEATVVIKVKILLKLQNLKSDSLISRISSVATQIDMSRL